ncbi:hypothetical protein FACS189490_06210 [Clostridia bacterium]|nr:hypothetical protein FACS189490_06210 [Clostridia bacterium]
MRDDLDDLDEAGKERIIVTGDEVKNVMDSLGREARPRRESVSSLYGSEDGYKDYTKERADRWADPNSTPSITSRRSEIDNDDEPTVRPRTTSRPRPAARAKSSGRLSGAVKELMGGDGKIILFFVIVLFFAILLIMTITTSSTQAELDAEREKNKTVTQTEQKYNEAIIKNEQLTGANAALLSENAELKAKLALAQGQIDDSYFQSATTVEPEAPPEQAGVVAPPIINQPAPTVAPAATPYPTARPADPTANPPAGGRRHTVAEQETLWSIATYYYGSGNRYTDIMSANNIANENSITVGDVLIIP